MIINYLNELGLGRVIITSKSNYKLIHDMLKRNNYVIISEEYD